MLTSREAGLADRSPMANEIDMRGIHLRRWNERLEHPMGTLCRASGGEQPEPCRDPINMRIDWEGWMPTGEQEDAGDCLRPHTGKFCQERPCCGHWHIHQKIQA